MIGRYFMTNNKFKKIVIIGNGGSGKTTLARYLFEHFKLPIFHLDKYFFDGWKVVPEKVWKKSHDMLIRQSEWIIEGAQITEFKQRILASDYVIFLDMPTYICAYRFIKKYIDAIRKKMIEDDGFCYDKFSFKSFFWLLSFRRNYRNVIIDCIRTNNKSYMIIKNNKDKRQYIEKIKNQ